MNTKLIAKNPTAYHNYTIENKLEAGIVLSGTEIKSIIKGKANLKDSYAIIKNGEVYIVGMHISPYEYGNIFNKDPLRDRKLLLNKREINKLIGLTKQKGYSLIPISLYFKGSLVKVELGIGKGKKFRPPIVFQGGVSKNVGVKKAFEDAVGHEVIVDKNGHLMGAFGVAVLAKKSGIEKDFSFDVADIKFRTTGFDCPKCANHCEIVCVFKDNKLIDSWGNKCDNGAVKIN